MPVEIGHVEAIFRYPVKSMRGEPLEVAGAFTIDSLGGPFITRVDGGPSTVVGLSLSTLRELVLRLGVEWTDLWNRAQ